jgi:hypothetical protein
VGLAVALTIVGVGGADGGFFPQTWRWTSLALLAGAGAVLMFREQIALTRREAAGVGILLVLSGWSLLSWTWSSVPALAAPEAERALLYAAALQAFLAVFDPRSTVPVLVGLLGAATVLSAWALAGYASAPLVGPLGYANGAGELAAVGVVIATGLAVGAADRLARLGALAPLVVLVPTLLLSKSAGAGLAAIVGLVVVAVAYRHALPGRALGAALVLALGALAIVWLARGHPTAGLTGNIRWSYWNAAVHDYGGHPVLGSGAGSFGRYWAAHKTTHLGALDAHSLYVEALAELGIVGLALVAAFVVNAFLAAREARTRWTAVVAAAFATYVVHTGIDWDWELPATMLPGVVLAGILLAGTRRGAATSLSEPRRLLLAAGIGAFAILVLVRLKTAT